MGILHPHLQHTNAYDKLCVSIRVNALAYRDVTEGRCPWISQLLGQTSNICMGMKETSSNVAG